RVPPQVRKSLALNSPSMNDLMYSFNRLDVRLASSPSSLRYRKMRPLPGSSLSSLSASARSPPTIAVRPQIPLSRIRKQDPATSVGTVTLAECRDSEAPVPPRVLLRADAKPAEIDETDRDCTHASGRERVELEVLGHLLAQLRQLLGESNQPVEFLLLLSRSK